jgi:hypothetical protein
MIQAIFSGYWKHEPSNWEYQLLIERVGEWMVREKGAKMIEGKANVMDPYRPANVDATFDTRFFRPLVNLQAIMSKQTDRTYNRLILGEELVWYHQVTEALTLIGLMLLGSLRQSRLWKERFVQRERLEHLLDLELKYLYFGGRLTRTPLVMQLLGHLAVLAAVGQADNQL